MNTRQLTNFDRRYPTLLGEWLGKHYGNNRVRVYKRAVEGGTTTSNRTWIQADITGFEPDLVTIRFGHNQMPAKGREAEATRVFVADMVSYLEEVAGWTKTKPTAVVMTPNPRGQTDAQWSIFDGYADGLRTRARENRNLVLADVYQHFKALANPEEYRKTYTSDGVHPTLKGDEEIARVLFKAITGEDRQ